MEIIGKLMQILPKQSGESARGTWVRGGFVIETQEQFPKMVAFTMFGEDRTAMIEGIPVGTQINVHFSPESREFQGRWYTDLRCFRIDTFVQAQPAAGNFQQATPQPIPMAAQQQPVQQAPDFASAPQQPAADTQMGVDDDLPF
ncbi:MAG: DUF3127 domain-containing protein [Bacteroidales bacterium]|nr:DUF3127 domain-containing protein [Bacteroidales bacterium]